MLLMLYIGAILSCATVSPVICNVICNLQPVTWNLQPAFSANLQCENEFKVQLVFLCVRT